MFRYFTALARYATFDGRSGRAEFWSYTFTSGLIVLVARWAYARWPTTVPYPDLIVLAHLVPTTAVQVRRLHDIGRTGWWLLLGLTVVGILPLVVWWCSAGSQAHSRVEPMFRDPSMAATDVRALASLPEPYGPARSIRLSDAAFMGVLLAGVAVPLLLFAFRSDLTQFGEVVAGAWALDNSEVSDVPGYLVAHHLDEAKVVTGGSRFEGGVLPLMVVARCLATAPPGGFDRTLSLIDDGEGQYRFVLRSNNLRISFHVRLLAPNGALFDQIDDGSQVETRAEAIDESLFELTAPCLAMLEQ